MTSTPPYLTAYLLKKIKDPDLAESIKFEMDRRVYHYGDQFIAGIEPNKKPRLRERLRRPILNMLQMFSRPPNSEFILSNSYVSASTFHIQSRSFQLVRPPWDATPKSFIAYGNPTFKIIQDFKRRLNSASIRELVSDEFQTCAAEMKTHLSKYLSQPLCQGTIFSNDITFFETLSVLILRKLGKPSMIMLHGLPAIYNKRLSGLADYTLVWSETIKSHMCSFGIAAEKIKVVGHPFIQFTERPVRNDLENVLVLTRALPGAQYEYVTPILGDRGNSLLHCYQIQSALQKLGVRRATLRRHPSENPDWYRNGLDMKFFSLDENALPGPSLARASLVIGPSSTMFLEALSAGVNYVVFEPLHGNRNLANYPLVPPFDGSNANVAFADSESALEDVLRARKLSDPKLVKEYCGESFSLDQALAEILTRSK